MSVLTYATAQLIRVLPRAHVGRALGRLADKPWSPRVGRAIVGLYRRAYDLRFDECVEREGWASFDAFFTRRLRDGARPLPADKGALVSPADGRLESAGAIDASSTFTVKGRPYRVAELVGDEREADRYRGGHGCVVYLSPRDYHRVHSPVGGIVRRVRSMPGDYFPVNAIGMRHVPQLFVRNRRVAIEIEPAGGAGRVTLVMVVAMIVGRITVSGIAAHDVPIGDHTFEPPAPVARGDELGVFHLGSTVVMLVDSAAAGGGWLADPGPIRVGQALLRGPADRPEAGMAPHGGGQ